MDVDLSALPLPKGEGRGEGEGRVVKKAGAQNKTTIAVGNRRLLSDLRTLNFPLSTFLPLACLALTVGVFSLHKPWWAYEFIRPLATREYDISMGSRLLKPELTNRSMRRETISRGCNRQRGRSGGKPFPYPLVSVTKYALLPPLSLYL